MAWSWGHSNEAEINVARNLLDIPRTDLEIIWAEWEASKDGEFTDAIYEEHLRRAKAKLSVKLAADILSSATNQRICDNGGHNAWVCPYGCHTVSFNRD